MSANTVLVLGGTGRTGSQVVTRLLEQGVSVRAIVRSAAKLPDDVAKHPAFTAIEASLLDLPDSELVRHVAGCDAVVSCLGPNVSLQGVFGKPRDLVTQAVRRTCAAITVNRPATPVRFVLMSSVTVNDPAGRDTLRGPLEKGVVALLRGVMPPAKDNQRASDVLHREIGPGHESIEWVAVRPDTLREEDVSEYEVHPQLVSSLFRPDETNIANVAHFMCELLTDDTLWATWRGRFPVMVNAS